jgi:hypothetical protein
VLAPLLACVAAFAIVAEDAKRNFMVPLQDSSPRPGTPPNTDDMPGGLMAYGIDDVDITRRLADYIARILKGAKPSELPIHQATKILITPMSPLAFSPRRLIGRVWARSAHEALRPTDRDECSMALLIRVVVPVELCETQPLLELHRIARHHSHWPQTRHING